MATVAMHDREGDATHATCAIHGPKRCFYPTTCKLLLSSYLQEMSKKPESHKVSEVNPAMFTISNRPKDGKVSTALSYITYNTRHAIIDLEQDMHSQYGMSTIEGKWGLDLTFNDIDKDPGLQKMHDQFAAVSARLISLMEDPIGLNLKIKFKDREECISKFNPIIKSFNN